MARQFNHLQERQTTLRCLLSIIGMIQFYFVICVTLTNDVGYYPVWAEFYMIRVLSLSNLTLDNNQRRQHIKYEMFSACLARYFRLY